MNDVSEEPVHPRGHHRALLAVRLPDARSRSADARPSRTGVGEAWRLCVLEHRGLPAALHAATRLSGVRGCELLARRLSLLCALPSRGRTPDRGALLLAK